MRVKVVVGKTIGEAMQTVRSTLGPDALILGQQKRPDGTIELTAALDTDEDNEGRFFGERSGRVLPQTAQWQQRTTAQSDRETLAWHGVPPFVQTGLAEAGSLRRLLRKCSFAPIGPLLARQPIVVSGMAGGGKTTVAIRFAVRLVIAGVKPVIINADDRRAGADHQIKAYARLLGIEVISATSTKDIAAHLQTINGERPVIVDTAGFSASDMQAARRLGSFAERIEGALVHVLPAGLDACESLDLARTFLDAGARHTVVTRVDCHRRLGGLLAMAVAGIPVSEIGTSDAVAGGGRALDEQSLFEAISRSADEMGQNAARAQSRVVANDMSAEAEVTRHRGASLLAQHISAQKEN
jgi:flagellar biosynthesis protein FlhF